MRYASGAVGAVLPPVRGVPLGMDGQPDPVQLQGTLAEVQDATAGLQAARWPVRLLALGAGYLVWRSLTAK